MSNPLLSDFVATPVAEIAAIHERLNNSFLSGKTRDVEFRRVQLRKLYHGIKDNSQRILAALKEDLNKPSTEAVMAEVDWTLKDLMYALNHLNKWVKDEPGDVAFIYKMMKPRLRKDPIGNVLIIGAFNYPVQLILVPLVGAIAAGCTAVIKPSELTPRSAAVVERIVKAVLDPDCYAVVNGGVEESTELLKPRWDKIMYTGSGAVARIISQAAAKHLTPVILELGGLNPVFVTPNFDPKLAAKRIAFGKVHNAGQICLSPDYIMVDPKVEKEFVEGYIQSINSFFPNGTKDKQNYARIVNDRHFQRITGLLERTKGTVVFGGKSDAAERWIEPTLVKIDSLDDPLLSEEIFGPVLPYYVAKGGVQEMVGIVRSVGDCPLGLYAFTNDKTEQELIMAATRSGGVTFNDVMFHAIIPTLPFGGVGSSGTGSYRGKYSFDAFVHKRPIVEQPGWVEGQMRVRYPPYSAKALDRYRKMQGVPTPNFDKKGKLLYGGFIWRILLLGAAQPKGGLVRLLLAVLGAFILKGGLGKK